MKEAHAQGAMVGQLVHLELAFLPGEVFLTRLVQGLSRKDGTRSASPYQPEVTDMSTFSFLLSNIHIM